LDVPGMVKAVILFVELNPNARAHPRVVQDRRIKGQPI
jgi:hypothetical protein